MHFDTLPLLLPHAWIRDVNKNSLMEREPNARTMLRNLNRCELLSRLHSYGHRDCSCHPAVIHRLKEMSDGPHDVHGFYH